MGEPILEAVISEIRRTAPTLHYTRHKSRALFSEGVDVLAVVARSNGVELLFLDDIVFFVGECEQWKSGTVITGVDTQTLSSLRALVRKLQLAGLERRQQLVPERQRRLRES
ncbi:MAG TPA: hypothetical protein VE869_17770 [Gemmatimonas sp.]|nr:hypothetical protein [Gemmatimonas sp.]